MNNPHCELDMKEKGKRRMGRRGGSRDRKKDGEEGWGGVMGRRGREEEKK